MRRLTDYMRAHGTSKLYRTKTSIFFQGEIPQYSVLLLDGAVKAYTISKDGRESIVHLFGKGSIIPAAWTNNQSPSVLFNYDTITDVRAIAFPKQMLYDILQTDPLVETEYREHLAYSQASLLIRVTGLTQNRTIDKLCYALYYLLFRYGIEKAPGSFEIDLKITQGILAQLIGQTRESVAKNLKALAEKRIVSYTTSTYTINKPLLESFLGEDSFRDLTR